MLKLVILICLTSLSACSTSNSSRPFTPASVNDGMAAVYIYRPPVMANAIYSPDLSINEELKLSIKNGNNSRLNLPVGDYVFALDADNNERQLTKLSLKLTSGNTYYIRITTSLKITDTARYEPYQRNFNMHNVDEEHALAQIARCCTNKDKNPAADSTVKQSDKTTDTGFSVDKTQNPFSH